MPDGVNVVGYLHEDQGLGEIARLVIRALEHRQIPHAVVALGKRPVRQRLLRANPHFDTNIVCVNARMLPGLVEMLGARFFRDRRTIGFWWWEIDRFPPVMSWAAYLLDEIWVGSEHVRNAIAATVAKPVFTFPVPILTPAVSPLSRSSLGIPDDRFAFLFSFSFWSVFARKNPLGLIEAFSRAFSPDEGPVLVLKTVNGADFREQLHHLQAAASERPDVFVVDRRLSPTHYAGLVAACDAYASLHRAEGFGLTIAEAMALGKPAVATAYSGNLAFMREENSYLVPYRLVEIPAGVEPYAAGGHWAEPDLVAAASLFRRIVERPQEVAERVHAAHSDLAAHHSLNVAADFVDRRLAATPEPWRLPTGPVERAAAELMWGPDLETARPSARLLRQLVRPFLRPYVDHQRRVGALILEALNESAQGVDSTTAAEQRPEQTVD
jgi:glycosyltransferase involved in cell wall biosynthesis